MTVLAVTPNADRRKLNCDSCVDLVLYGTEQDTGGHCEAQG